MRKKTLRVFCLLLALMTALPLDGMAATKKLRGYDSTQKKSARYQYVQLGTYPYEEDGTQKPVLWLVLSVSENKALLFSDMILDNKQAVYAKTRRDLDNRRYRRIKDFTESDLYAWMNKDMLNTLFKGDKMKDALVEDKYGKLYPLTDEQLLTKAYGFSDNRYFNHPERQAEATPYAKGIRQYTWSKKITITWQNSTKRNTSPYWVVAFRNPNTMDRNYMMQIVGTNGHLSYGAYARTDVGVRPALTLDLTKCKIKSGSGTKKKPFILKYTGETEKTKETDNSQ